MTDYPDNGTMSLQAAVVAAKDHGDAIAYHDPEQGGYGWYSHEDYGNPAVKPRVHPFWCVHDTRMTPEQNAGLVETVDIDIDLERLAAGLTQ